ncbi:MAG: MBL fold metallo-hydrolase [Planctomycetes bacterium]|nr:MBL fold metallo-hydrolase [Planctomycetota bacterium]
MPRPFVALVLAALVLLAGAAAAQQPDPRIRTIEVRPGVYMLQGNGGNIGVGIGEDGVFVIDDQFAPMVDQIKAAVRKLTDQDVRFVLNTHWHGDHTGGNERFGKAGAVILAHENVRKRMSVEQFMQAMNRKVPASPAAALPVVTFADDVTLHWGGDEVHFFHVAPAHTDGDAIVHFTKANVIHMGDTFFASGFPFIDTGSGGTLAGVIAAADRVLKLADDDTRIIPGHGDLSDKRGPAAYRDMLATIRDRVTDLVVKGRTADEVVTAGPAQEWSERLGKGFISTERFVRMAFAEVVRERAAAGGDRREEDEVVRIMGSDVMLNLAQQWAKAHAAVPGPHAQLQIAGGGSGVGLAALLEGRGDLAMTTREPEPAERDAATRVGIEFRIVPVGKGRLTSAPRVFDCYLVASTAASPAARAFLDWVRSPAGIAVTRKVGCEPAGAAK